MTKDIGVIHTQRGLYVKLDDIIKMVLWHHNMYPCMTTQNIFDALRIARRKYYDLQGDSSTDNGGAGIDPAHT